MGKPVDKPVAPPFYFTKSLSSPVCSRARVAYPPATKNFPVVMGLVVAIGSAGFAVSAEDAHRLAPDCGAGLDMARATCCWQCATRADLGSGQGQRAVLGEPRDCADGGAIIEHGAIALKVDGET
jgi:fumarylpyruvate hydrolase